MATTVQHLTGLKQPAAGRGSTPRRWLLLLLFVVLIIDLLPGKGLGIVKGLSGKNLLLYIIVLMIGIRAVVRSRELRFSDLDVHTPFLLLILYATVTIVIASAFTPTYNLLQGIISLKNELVDLFLFMFAFRYAVDSRADYLLILRFILSAMLIISVVTLVDFFNIPDLGIIGMHRGRIEGPFGEANQYGGLLAFLIPITIAAVRPEWSRFRRALWWVGIAITAALLIATGSRGAYASLIFGGALGVAILRNHLDMRQVLRFVAIASAVGVVLFVVFAIFNSDLLIARIEKTFSSDINVATSGRLDIWSATLRIMLEWPWSFVVGNGWNSFDASGLWKSAHNEYLDRLYELGMIGLFIMLLLLRAITVRPRRRIQYADNEARRLLIGYVFAMSIVTVNIFFAGLPGPWTIFWIVTGLIAGLQATLPSQLQRDRTTAH